MAALALIAAESNAVTLSVDALAMDEHTASEETNTEDNASTEVTTPDDVAATEGAATHKGCDSGTSPMETKDIDGNNVIVCITFNVHVITKEQTPLESVL